MPYYHTVQAASDVLASRTTFVVIVFAVVYLGMFLGGLPRLHLDRTGVALLGAIAIVGGGILTTEQAARAVHLPTVVLLFSFMVISAQMRLGGFYSAVTRRLAALPFSPPAFMAVIIAVVAVLSAVFSNDIVCLAVAPVLADACVRRRIDPVPYLLALAAASNIGSAATLIGNPQNMLIGEVLGLPFAGYMAEAIVPVVLSLAALWFLLTRATPPATSVSMAFPRREADVLEEPALDRWQTVKGLLMAGGLVVVFLVTDWPRDVAALVAAGILLLSQRFHSSKVMGLIDWELLVLFVGLFVVNHALEVTGATERAIAWIGAQGVMLGDPGPLFAVTLFLSNIVSNVPAVMLLLPVAGGPHAGPTLALVSTLAGNLLIVGSIANIIVVDAARRQGIEIDWRTHARVGVPVTVVTLLITALWLNR
jgi:Na+/H+ antiporter NhaD/arsenite permease-like protein